VYKASKRGLCCSLPSAPDASQGKSASSARKARLVPAALPERDLFRTLAGHKIFIMNGGTPDILGEIIHIMLGCRTV